jgi:hypothetical protein
MEGGDRAMHPFWMLNAIHAAMLSLLWLFGWGLVLRVAALMRVLVAI